MERDKVILVDEKDRETGIMNKLEAHEKGLLHRAFSIFIFNHENQLLLQQRALSKYHSPGLWTNTCCSHPQPGEILIESAQRRLMEEMGFSCDITKIFDFTYKAEVGNGLTEHEFDHVFTGLYSSDPFPNKEEVADFRWISMEKLLLEIRENPEKFTIWFRIILERYLKYLQEF